MNFSAWVFLGTQLTTAASVSRMDKIHGEGSSPEQLIAVYWARESSVICLILCYSLFLCCFAHLALLVLSVLRWIRYDVAN